MPTTGPAIFWSYAHADDEAADGAITGLAGRLTAAYSLLTGQSLELFIDSQGIKWGDEWRTRIDNALADTTFMVPVLTPRYFARPECRRELLTFHAQAESLGVGELVMPILFVPVANFSAENPDEAIALASRSQYVDWTDLRLESHTSSRYRREVDRMAQRLLEVSERVHALQLARETDEVSDREQPEPGFYELLAGIDHLLPDWEDALDADIVVTKQFQATWDVYGARLTRLERSGGQAGPRMALLQKLGQEMLPLAQRRRELARTYSAKTLELNPLVTAVLRIAEAHPEELPALESLRRVLRRAEHNLDEERRIMAAGGQYAGHWAAERAHLSRIMREIAETYRVAERFTQEGNDVVIGWISSMNELAAMQEGGEPAGGAGAPADGT